MGNCESLASKAFTSDSNGLAGGALGAATTGAGSGGATLWQRAACKPENAHTRTRTKIRRVNDCLVERKTIRPMKSVNSNFHFNGKRAVLLAPSTGQCQVKSKGLCGQAGNLFCRAVPLKSYFGAEARRLSQYLLLVNIGHRNRVYKTLFDFSILATNRLLLYKDRSPP